MNNFFSGRIEKYFTEQQLIEISHGLTEQEEKRCRNAIDEVIYALKFCGFESRNYSHPIYSINQEYKRMIYSPLQDKYNIQIAVFLQGSYANNTNVKGRSDVDIAVVLLNQFNPTYNSSTYLHQQNKINYSNTNNYINIKNIIEKGFIEYFGKDYVVRHDKCINIKPTRERNNIDVVPAIQFSDYTQYYNYYNMNNDRNGTLIQTDKGKVIINYPFAHIENSYKKHYATLRRYRKFVRIMKYLMYDMQNENIAEAKDVSSFGVESLMFSITNDYYLSYNYMGLGTQFNWLIDIFIHMLSNNYHNWVEANGIKPLFPYTLYFDNNEKEKYKRFIYKLKSYFKYMG